MLGRSNVPKQFRKENLAEGLEENFSSIPKSMFGLTPTQIDMLMTEDNPISRMSSKVTEETISAKHWYREGTGTWSMHGVDPLKSSSRLSMSARMYRGGGPSGRPRQSPPDLPTLLLDNRIVYLGMPIVRAVSELVVAELLWLEFDNPTKPIYMYINSTGALNDKNENVAFETDAYAIADTMRYIKSKVYTINLGRAFGQAAMLLALGDKGNRATQPNATVKVYSPRIAQSSGPAVDMWIKAKELEANTESFIKLLAKGTGKTEDIIRRDIQRPMYFQGAQGIEYGIIDKVIKPQGIDLEKKDYDAMMAQARAANPPRKVPAPKAAPGV